MSGFCSAHRQYDSACQQCARFIIDHGVIHDLSTGRHVRTALNGDEDGVDECCALLNSLATNNIKLREIVVASQRSVAGLEGFLAGIASNASMGRALAKDALDTLGRKP